MHGQNTSMQGYFIAVGNSVLRNLYTDTGFQLTIEKYPSVVFTTENTAN